jgi:sugar phosphate isomerase/epimerase
MKASLDCAAVQSNSGLSAVPLPGVDTVFGRTARLIDRSSFGQMEGRRMSQMSIRVGNQTNYHVAPRLPYEFAVRQGFDAFEWFSDKGRSGWCEDDTPTTERAELRRVSQSHGLLFSVHAPYAADPTTQRGAEAILKSIRFGGDVGAGVINLHLFPEHKARPFAESLGPLLEAARAIGVRLSLENTPQTAPDDFNAVFGVLSAMPEAAGRVGMCLDSGHANLFAGTRNDFLRFVDLLGDHVPIIHWHAHENWGDRDSHLPLFTGPSAGDDRGLRGLVHRLKGRGFAGSVVLEQWPNPPEVLVETRRRLRQLLAEG